MRRDIVGSVTNEWAERLAATEESLHFTEEAA
jgi:hypothetical protein